MNKLLSFLVIPVCLIVGFSSFYQKQITKIEYSFFDEMLWVGRSFYFQHFIHRDFSSEVWRIYESYDQPKLAELLYGAWLYPHYLVEKSNRDEVGFDYTKFLMIHHFYSPVTHVNEEYKTYYDSHVPPLITYDPDDHGPPAYYVRKYGVESLNTLAILNRARLLNVLLLAFSILPVYFLVFRYKGAFVALLFSLSYGFNHLLIATSLKAHSEALFILLFNTALFIMTRYFISKQRTLLLVVFALLAGLCTATKLNGSMLLIIFTGLIVYLFFTRKEITLVKSVSHLAICFSIAYLTFAVLNPYIYEKPIRNTVELFHHRTATANEQTRHYPHDSLPDYTARVQALYQNFFTDKPQYQPVNYSTPTVAPIIGEYGPLMLLLFTIGVFGEVFNKKTPAIRTIILLSFFLTLIITTSYLQLNWDRYFLHLVMFIILYQLLGAYFIAKYLLRAITYEKHVILYTAVHILPKKMQKTIIKNQNLMV